MDYISILIYLALILLLIILILVMRKIIQHRQRDIWLESRKNTLLQISVPKNNEKTPLAAEQMFAALHGIYRHSTAFQEHLSFEIASKDKYIQFYVYVPMYLKDFVEGQIYAQYPTVEIVEVEDYTKNIPLETKIAGTELITNQEDVYPIKTFENFDVDPLAGITGVLAKVMVTEQAWIQIIISPVPDTWQKKGIGLVNAIRSGKPPSNLPKKFFEGFFSFIGALVGSAINPVTEIAPSALSEIKLSGPQEAAMTGIEEKVTKLGFSTKIRIITLSDSFTVAMNKLSGIVGAFKQFNTTNLNGFSSGKLRIDRKFLEEYQHRSFEHDGYIFNISELASIFHLPNISVQTPNIVWAGSKKGEPPSNLPVEGTVASKDLTVFGKTDFRHIQHKFGIKIGDRRYHMYAIGKTGTGKSTMLENMVIDDIREGRGVAVVDPHGDLIKNLMDFVPDERINDVVIFRPADREFPVGFNVLENVDPDLKSIVASGVVGIFKKIFGESWGPRLEYILRNTILALLDYPNATLLGVTRLLVDKDYRQNVIDKITDPVIKDFFVNEYERYDPKFRTEAIAPIQNKVGQFLSSSTIRNIVGQPKSTIDLTDIMNNKKILFIDLSIGEIGEDSSALLGAMMITKIQLTAMGRASIPEEERVDFYLYVDEFQNFATESFAVILSEARKYHLNLIMTNQYIAQMLEEVANAIFGNIGSLVSFRVGAADATALIKEYAPVFEENDLVNLDNYHIYIKMSIDGVTCPAFSAVTLPPAAGKNDNRGEIIAFSRKVYGRPRSQIEQNILQWAEYGPLDQKGDRTSKDFDKPLGRLQQNPIVTEKRGEAGEKEATGGSQVNSSEDKEPQKTFFELEGKIYRKLDSKGDTWYIHESDIVRPIKETEEDKKEDIRPNSSPQASANTRGVVTGEIKEGEEIKP